jgi:hypothetical protein
MHLSQLPHELDSHAVRLLCREGSFRATTAGFGPGQVQANLLIVHKKYADDFRGLCRRNPVSCPLLGECRGPGDARIAGHLAQDGDVATDAPGYNVQVSLLSLALWLVLIPSVFIVTKMVFSKLPTNAIVGQNGPRTALRS